MPKKILVAPSILSADFSRLGEEIAAVESAGADWVHIDVMDGHFVPNITIGPAVVASIRPVTRLLFDVHLMIDKPERYIEAFASSGADMITFHMEACGDPLAFIKMIKKCGKKAGVSVKPGTDISVVDAVMKAADMVLVMTVEPGFGGQSFMEGMMGKIRYVKERFSGYIEVDGGINKEAAAKAAEAGADVLVAGTAIFREKDYSEAIKAIRGI